MDAVVTDADNNLLHMAAWAFDNAGNNPNQRVHAARENAADPIPVPDGPQIIDFFNNKLASEITDDMPFVGAGFADD